MSKNLRYYLVISVAVALTIVSSFLTISGYLSLYSGHTLIISVLFVTLEVAKATIFGIVFVYAQRKNKMILLVLASFLVCLSFFGHLSFLNASYASNKIEAKVGLEIASQAKDTHTQQLDDLSQQIELIKDQIQAGKDEIQTLTQTATGLGTANSRNWAVSTNKKRIKEIQDQNIQLQQDIQSLYTQRRELLDTSLQTAKTSSRQVAESTNRSVFQHSAEMFRISQDTLAHIINFILALVIDTLALTMLWTAGEMWKQRHRPHQKPTFNLDLDTPTPIADTPQDNDLVDDPVPDNIEQYLFNGKSVEDVVGMNDDEVDSLKSKVKTKAQLDWLNFALKLRELKSDLRYEELK